MRLSRCLCFFLLFIAICFSFLGFYSEKPEYLLHVVSNANNLAVENITWNINGINHTTKSANFSVDSTLRGHDIFIPHGKYNNIKIFCYSPERITNTKCSIDSVSISNISKNKVYFISGSKAIVNESSIEYPLQVINLPNISLKEMMKCTAKQMLPIFLILLLLFFTQCRIGSILFATMFSTMFIYALLSFSSINTGMDAMENVNIAKYIFSHTPYCSYVEYRGYMWFFILWLINEFADVFGLDFYYAYTIYGSLLFSALVVILIPEFISYVFGKNANIKNYTIMIFGAVIIFLFGKQFLCPLPDLTPIFFIYLALFYLTRENSHKINFILAGSFIGIACLIRSNYYLTAFVIVSSYIILSSKNYVLYKTRIFHMIFFLFPILLLSFMNQEIKPSLIKLNSANLSRAILYQGMQVQKTSPFEIKDARGIKILNLENITEAGQLSLMNYLSIIAKYPFDFLTMYSIRLFNGLDIKYPQVYASESGGRLLFSLINYICMFLGVFNLFKFVNLTNKYVLRNSYLIAISIPGLIMMVSFVEPRYFLQLSFLLVASGVLLMNGELFKNKKFIIKMFLFIIICFMISGAVYNQSVNNLLLFG